jgi:hypothetical protein
MASLQFSERLTLVSIESRLSEAEAAKPSVALPLRGSFPFDLQHFPGERRPNAIYNTLIGSFLRTFVWRFSFN